MLGKRDVLVYLDCLRLIKLTKLICYSESFLLSASSATRRWLGFFFYLFVIEFRRKISLIQVANNKSYKQDVDYLEHVFQIPSFSMLDILYRTCYQ